MAYGMIVNNDNLNPGGTPVTIATNYQKFVNNTSDAGREVVVKITRGNGSVAIRHEDLLKAYAQLTQTGGDGTGFDQDGPDAGTFAALGTVDGTPFASGTTTAVFVRLQTTGTPKTTDITVSGGDVKFEVVATFAPRF
jgi:hypothetical protein